MFKIRLGIWALLLCGGSGLLAAETPQVLPTYTVTATRIEQADPSVTSLDYDGYRDHNEIENRRLNAKFTYDFSASSSLTALINLIDLPLQIDGNDYAAIFFAGGHGTMWDFPGSDAVTARITEIYQKGGVVGAVCHGPAALVGVEIDGQLLVAGKRVAAFTNDEESAFKLTEAMPFLLVPNAICSSGIWGGRSSEPAQALQPGEVTP